MNTKSAQSLRFTVVVCLVLASYAAVVPGAFAEVQVHRASAPVSLAADASTTLSLTWDAPFPDANYTPVCSLVATDGGDSGFAIVVSQTAAGAVVSVRDGSASVAHTYELDCIAVQNAASPAGIAYATTTQTLAADTSMDLVLNWSQSVPNGTAVCTLASSTATSGYVLILMDGLTTISVRLRNTSAQSSNTYTINCIDVPISGSLVLGMTQAELEPIDIAADTTIPETVSWTAALPSSSYTAVCSPETLSSAVSAQTLITTKATGSVMVNLRNTNASTVETLGVACIAATSADTTAPTVVITAPSNGATATGTTTVSANAADNIGVVGVQFKLDGANLGAEDTTAPYSVSWDTTQSATGSHTLTAVARDAAGNTTTSTAVNVTVQRTDTTPPTVSVTSPANGATVSGTNVNVTGTATDNVGVVGVQFKIDGANLGTESTAPPYSAPWNTTVVQNGTHTLGAVARDAAGNIGTATTVSVTVNNPPDFQMDFGPGSPTSATVTPNNNTGFFVRFGKVSAPLTVTLSCNSVPSGPTCYLGPSNSVVLSTTATTDANISILTSTGPPPPHNGTKPFGAALVLVPGVVLFGGVIGGKRSRAWLMIALVSVTLLCVVGMQGCSNSNADVVQGSIPPGTYAVTMTATAGQFSHSVVFTLTMTK